MLAFHFKNSYFLEFLWTTLSFRVRVHTDMIFRRLTWFWPHLAKIAQVITENLFRFNFLAYTLSSFPVMIMNSWSLMRESWSLPLRIYSVNVNCLFIHSFIHIYSFSLFIHSLFIQWMWMWNPLRIWSHLLKKSTVENFVLLSSDSTAMLSNQSKTTPFEYR